METLQGNQVLSAEIGGVESVDKRHFRGPLKTVIRRPLVVVELVMVLVLLVVVLAVLMVMLVMVVLHPCRDTDSRSDDAGTCSYRGAEWSEARDCCPSNNR